MADPPPPRLKLQTARHRSASSRRIAWAHTGCFVKLQTTRYRSASSRRIEATPRQHRCAIPLGRYCGCWLVCSKSCRGNKSSVPQHSCSTTPPEAIISPNFLLFPLIKRGPHMYYVLFLSLYMKNRNFSCGPHQPFWTKEKSSWCGIICRMVQYIHSRCKPNEPEFKIYTVA
jgi:hypothetical protein